MGIIPSYSYSRVDTQGEEKTQPETEIENNKIIENKNLPLSKF